MQRTMFPSLVGMPERGLWRAGRWADVDRYPAPAGRLRLSSPVLDGPRWEDAFGRFATAKCSATPEAAIGRTIARYRPRDVPNGPEQDVASTHDNRPRGIINVILAYLEGPADDGEPELVDGEVPADVNDDLYLIEVPASRGAVFVDLGDPNTLRALDEMLREALDALGVTANLENICRETDRRVTRLAMRALHSQFSDGSLGPVAGVRYPGQPDPEWEAFVLWSPPTLVELTGDDVAFRWVSAWDADFVAACHRLGIRPPRGHSVQAE